MVSPAGWYRFGEALDGPGRRKPHFGDRHLIKRFIIAFVLLVLVAGGIVGFNLFRDQAIKDFFAGMKPPPVTVSTALASRSLSAGSQGVAAWW